MLFETFLVGCLIGFSLLLMLTSFISYARIKSKRLLFVAIAFLLFFVQGLLLIAAILIQDFWIRFKPTVEFLLLDLGILFFMYLAVAKK